MLMWQPIIFHIFTKAGPFWNQPPSHRKLLSNTVGCALVEYIRGRLDLDDRSIRKLITLKLLRNHSGYGFSTGTFEIINLVVWF